MYKNGWGSAGENELRLRFIVDEAESGSSYETRQT